MTLTSSQAALSTSSAKDRLDLVTQLTDYVSEALAEVGSRKKLLWRLFHCIPALKACVSAGLSDGR